VVAAFYDVVHALLATSQRPARRSA
jgi:hypothetical protein